MGKISWQKAIKLIIEGKGYSICDTNDIKHSQYLDVAVPEIMVLNEYRDEQHLFDKANSEHTSFSAIRRRDNYTCAYCGNKGYTIDHIIPRSKGGTNKWDNLITCCSDCNQRKADKLLTELGWELLFEPQPIFYYEQQRVYEVVGSYKSA